MACRLSRLSKQEKHSRWRVLLLFLPWWERLGEGGAGGGVADEFGVAAEPAGDGAFGPGLGGGAAGGEFFIAQGNFEEVVGDVDVDGVAVLHEADDAAFGCFGGDVADAGAVGGTGEAAVGNQGDLFTESCADDVGRGG